MLEASREVAGTAPVARLGAIRCFAYKPLREPERKSLFADADGPVQQQRARQISAFYSGSE
jgi:hypothetical protein